MQKITYVLLFFAILPFLIVYLLFALTLPIFRFGRTSFGGPIRCYISKDIIHSDYIFESELWSEVFEVKSKFLKIGWGDRKIFLETQNWSDLSLKNFIFAFFGLNKTVLRIEFLDQIDEEMVFFDMQKHQFDIILEHVVSSTNMKIIEKMPWYNQNGIFFESDLRYNCITNCNNWINLGLRKANLSSKIWCPLTIWIQGESNE